LDRVPHRPGPRAGGPIIERTCVGGRRGREARSSGALGCAIAHLRLPAHDPALEPRASVDG
jgi:hypothetical protein